MHDCQRDRHGSKEELTHKKINSGKGKWVKQSGERDGVWGRKAELQHTFVRQESIREPSSRLSVTHSSFSFFSFFFPPVARRRCWSKNGKQTQSVEPWCRQIIHPSCHMIAHQSGRWGCIASSSWNNGCTCLPCHLCLLIVSLSYIGEASASPASDRRAFIWKSHYFQRDCSFCCFFFPSPLSFLSPPVFIFLFQRGGQRWELNECAEDTDFTSWLGEVTARGWKVHKHLFFAEEGRRDRQL